MDESRAIKIVWLVRVPAMKSECGISFCIITNGRRYEKLATTVSSILATVAKVKMRHDLVIAGATTALSKFALIPNAKTVSIDNPNQLACLGTLRNSAAQNAQHDILVFSDDDIVFPISWAAQFLNYCNCHNWEVLGNRILSPDGGRHWDRATLRPHRLVRYEHSEDDPNLYQSGGFVVLRREVTERIPWNDEIAYYAERQGGENEDVEFSRRLISAGYRLSFDQNNVVWHFDLNFQQCGDYVVKGRPPKPYCKEFAELLSSLQPAIEQLQLPVATPTTN